MEQGDQTTVTSWCLKTTARQSLGKLQTQQNFQMVSMGKINKKKVKIQNRRKEEHYVKDSGKNTRTKLHIALKGRTGCSRLATVSTTVPMSKDQTEFLKH